MPIICAYDSLINWWYWRTLLIPRIIIAKTGVDIEEQ